MKIKPYVEKLYASTEYKSFQKEHSGAYITAGFFVLDLEAGKHIHQIDFYVPKEKKVAAFTLDHGITMQMLALINSKVPEKLDIQTKIDLGALKGILDDEMKNRNITEEIKKIIAVLQNIEGKKIWNINCVLSGMGILRAHIEDDTQTVLKMEKASIMDYIRKMNPADLQKMKSQVGANSTQEEVQPNNQPEKNTKADPKEKLKQLEALEQAIEKEKKQIQESTKPKTEKANIPSKVVKQSSQKVTKGK
ncbi:MAG: hypothetical protein AABX66_00960 [Nanoarchaeota archaeon]